MIHKKYVFFFFYIAGITSSVHATDNLVEEYCACVKESNEVLKEAVDKIKANDMAAASVILQNMQGKIQKMETCTKALQEKYSTTNLPDSDKKKFEADIKSTCPTPSVEGLDQKPRAPVLK
jgi:hypothetical protein